MNEAVKSVIQRVVTIVIIFAIYLFRQVYDKVSIEHTDLHANVHGRDIYFIV